MVLSLFYVCVYDLLPAGLSLHVRGEGGEILAREGSVRAGRRAESEETALASRIRFLPKVQC